MKRRTVHGLLLMVVLWVSTATAAGFGAGAPEGVPDSWAVPEHMIGDRGRYTVTTVQQHGDNVTVLGDELALFDFAWLAPTTRIDLEGQVHHVFRLAVIPYGVGEEDLGVRYAAPIYEFDSTTGEMIAYTYESGRLESSGQRSIHFLAPDDNFSPPCSAQSPVAGTTFDPRSTHRLFDDCYFRGLGHGSMTFVARAPDQLAGVDALYFEGNQRGRPDTHVWLTQDHPYPLRVAVEDPDTSGLYRVARLVSFERGTEPMAPAPAVAALPPISWVDFDGSLPPGPAGHPFPATTAYEVSRSHEDAENLRSFLEAHPDAYVVWASYREREANPGGPGETTRTWTFRIGDGVADYKWWVTATRVGPIEGTSLLIEELGEDGYVFLEDGDITGVRSAPRDQLPPQIPDPQWLHQAWKATVLDGDLHAGWSVRVNCQATCDDMPVRFGYGIHHERSGQQDIVTSEFTYTLDPLRGNSMRSWEFRVADCADGCSSDDFTPTGFATSSSGSAHAVITYDTDVWGIPTVRAVVGAGLVSLLLTILYWAWPALKSGLLAPMFSRIQGPQLLEHPQRQAILELVGREPGISLRQANARLGGGRGGFGHHVEKLAAAGLLVRVQGSGRVGLFVPGRADHTLLEARTAIHAPRARQVLAAVSGAPGASLSEIARRLGISTSTVHHHVARLERARLIEAKADGSARRLYVTEIGQNAQAL